MDCTFYSCVDIDKKSFNITKPWDGNMILDWIKIERVKILVENKILNEKDLLICCRNKLAPINPIVNEGGVLGLL